MGRALVRLQGLGAVAFTGSRVVGTEVATVAARSHTRTVLELGGVDAAYVRPDVADVARAAASIASGAFHNAGQGCCAVERVYVHRDVYDSFVDAFVAEAVNIEPVTQRSRLRTLGRSLHAARWKGWRHTWTMRSAPEHTCCTAGKHPPRAGDTSTPSWWSGVTR